MIKPIAVTFTLSCFLPALAQYGVPTRAGATIPAGGIYFSSEDQFHGSVAAGPVTAQPLELSLQQAIDLGVRNNLGLLVRSTLNSAARADRLRVLSALLPDLSAGVTETETQIDLAVYGFHLNGIPNVVGPFSYTDARASAVSPVFDWTAMKNLRSAAESARAAALAVEDGRDLVVEAVASGYFLVLADAGRLEAARTQAQTADTLYRAARDRHQAGLSAAIDELRAQVEAKTQQQRLVAVQNALARDQLAFARAIGLVPGQSFRLTGEAAYRPLENLTAEDLLRRALESRADYHSAEAQLRAAEIARQAAHAERYPAAYLTANYGVIGPTLGSSHGSFTVAGSVSVNVFDGGRIRSELQSADAEIARRRGELGDLRGRIDFEVRSALLDLNTAAEEVALARDNLGLAGQTLDQARDRFDAGVADNIEVVQAQEALAAASFDVVGSLYAHNLAKVLLARAVGGAEVSLRQFLGGK
jgi:outer membrane protein TolC